MNFATWFDWFSILVCWALCILPVCRSVKETIDNNILETSLHTFVLKGNGEAWSVPTGKLHVETCGTGLPADFLFETKKVDLSLFNADVIYVDVTAEFTLCDNPETGKFQPCSSNFFEVYIHRGKNRPDITKGTAETVLSSQFYSIYNITANSSLLSQTPQEQKQTFTFDQHKTEGVTFAVRSRGACGKILNMTMYYYYCEEKFVDSVRLKKTPSPKVGAKLVTGNCSEHSQPSNNLTRLEGYCYRNGSWKMNGDLKCLCIEGYEPDEKLGCSFCSKDSFKQQTSNSACTQCPARRTSNENRTSCTCRNGYYKNPKDLTSALPCYALLALKDKPVYEVNETSVTIKWNEPDKTESLNESIFYDVECFLCKESICNLTCGNLKFNPGNENISTTLVVVRELTAGKSYKFRVYPKNNLNENILKNKWKFMETEQFTVQPSPTPDPPSSGEGNDDTTGNVVIAVIIVVLIILITILAILALKWRNLKKVRGENIELESVPSPPLPPLPAVPGTPQKTYVDPLIYVDVLDAVKKFANEIDPEALSLHDLIGAGEFGHVYKGTLILQDGKRICVAVKTLKFNCFNRLEVTVDQTGVLFFGQPTNANEKSIRDFLLEASAMGQFDDPNVIHLEGVITKVLPKMIVTEFMLNGSLDHYLKKNESEFTATQLFTMARGVASGMKYLAGINFIHRDLAARNILVDENMVCKVADFGLSRGLEATDSSEGEYFSQGGKIPVRWTAPEAIKFRTFSTASDVWSFGVLLWEIMSAAERPYGDWDNLKVMVRVDEGFRLPSPANCPQTVYELMLKCWSKEQILRPRFKDILATIDDWIESPESLRHRNIYAY